MNEGATFKITDSTISNNTASNSGGGIFNYAGSTATVINTVIANNTLNNTSGVTGATNQGGGIYNDSTLTVDNSTLSGNAAVSGKGIYSSGTLSLSSNTLDDVQTTGGGTTTLSGNITTTGTQIYGNAVTLTNNATLQGSNVTFNSTVNGAQTLGITGNAAFNGAVGGNTALTGLTVSGTTALNGGSVATTGTQTYSNAVTLGSNTTLQGSTVAFNSTVNGAQTLGITGNAAFNGVVGGSTALTGLTVSGTTAINGGSVTTTGAQQYTGAISGNSDLALNSSTGNVSTGAITNSGHAIAITGTGITTADINTSATNNGGNITFTASSGTINTGNLSAYAISGPGNGGNIRLNANGDVTVTGGIFSSAQGGGNSGAISLDSNLGSIRVLDPSTGFIQSAASNLGTSNAGNGGSVRFNAPNGSIEIAKTIVSQSTISDPANLTGNAGTGGDVTLIAGQNINFRNGAGIRSRSQIFNGSGNAGQGGNITVQAGGQISMTNGEGGIFGFAEDITSASTAITGNANNAGNIRLTGSQVDVRRLNASSTTNGGVKGTGGSIVVNAVSIATGDVTTTNNSVTLNGNVLLNSPLLTVSTSTNGSGGGAVFFNNAINGTTSGNQALTVNAGTGNVTFSGAIGTTNSLGDLTVNSTGNSQFNGSVNALSLTTNSGGAGTTALNGGSVTTTGTQAYSNAVTLGTNSILQGSTVTFNSIVNGARTLGVTGNATFNGAVGGSTALAGLTVSGTTALNGGSVTTTGTQTYSNAVTLGTNSILQGSTVTFNSIVNGARTLGVTGNATFNGAVGGSTALAGLTVSGTTALNGGSVTTTGTQEYTGAVAVGTDASLSGRTIAFNNTIDASNNALTLTADEINLNGAVTGTGKLTLQPLTSTRSIALGNPTDSGTDTLDLTSSDLAALQNGFGSITIGRADGSGTITVAENTTFQDPTKLRTPGGNISLNGGITLFDNATLSFDSANQPTTFLSRDIITTERSTSPLNFYGSVQLSNDITISTGNDIRFNGTLDGDRRLTLNAGDGIVQFNGAVGATTPLSSLLVNSQTTNVANNITTNGDLTLNSAVNLSNRAIMRSNGGSITATGTIAGVSGTPVDLKANGNITIQDASSDAGILLESKKVATSRNLTAPGTAITVIASDSIKAGTINASSSTGRGGDVKLDPIGDIEVDSINAQGDANSPGGNVDITAGRFFRALGTFTDRNGTLASISTAGGAGGGSITIRNGGGLTKTPFVIGDATKNGARGAITTGTFTLTPVQALLRSFNEGGIQIISTGEQDFTRNLVEPKQQGDQQESKKAAAKQGTDDLLNVVTLISVDKGNASQAVTKLESTSTAQYESYLGLSKEAALPQTVGDANSTLSRIEAAVGIKPAIVYISFAPTGDEPQNQLIQRSALSKSRDQLELILVTSSGQAIRKTVPGATRSRVQLLANQFRSAVTSPFRRRSTAPLLEPSQQLYKLLIAPLEPELKQQKIQNLAFILDSGLRSLPMAALYDAQTRSFLIEKYSLGLMPTLSLTDTRYVNIRNSQVLAMGASQFSTAGQGALPAVPLELDLIKEQWNAKSLADGNFTLSNLRDQPPFGIVHLATHASFQQGPPSKSYIQFEDKALGLDQLRTLNWRDQPPELVVLSACRTAFGSDEAELGFAGSAIQSRAKSVLASLWSVNDTGASGLMAEFYYQLKTAPIKAEALRKAQLAMLRGDVSIKDGKLHWSGGEKLLPPSLAGLANGDLSHPYYWSAFTLVGSPW